jgi:hypothetical protein
VIRTLVVILGAASPWLGLAILLLTERFERGLRKLEETPR